MGFYIAEHSTTLLVWGIVAHLIADWLFQNEWMATNKIRLGHPAAWVHSFIHFCMLGLVFPYYGAIIIFITHLLIDTRIPLTYWGKLIKQTDTGPISIHVAIWRDQVLHITIIAILALIFGK